jgi:hypothetical protein
MKQLLATAVITVLVGAGGAFAQTMAPSANPNASTPAVASPNANKPGAPAAGANSFTEARRNPALRKPATPTFPV